MPLPSGSGYARPASLSEAVALLAQGPQIILAGGTDLYPAAGPRLTGRVLDLSGIAGLDGLSQGDRGLRIGACVTWHQIRTAELPPSLFALQQAARRIGGWQIQSAGTIGGNLCNASPAADGVPPLLAVGAEVELAGPRGLRRLPLPQFLLGPRRTALMPDEVLAAVIVPDTALAGVSRFLKLGARAHLVISIAMVAVRIVADAGRVAQAAVAVGACSGVAQRMPAVERALCGLPLDQAVSAVHAADMSGLTPLDDLRASADYRREAAAELVARAVTEVVSCT